MKVSVLQNAHFLLAMFIIFEESDVYKDGEADY